jgi:hypothetical protein
LKLAVTAGGADVGGEVPRAAPRERSDPRAGTPSFVMRRSQPQMVTLVNGKVEARRVAVVRVVGSSDVGFLRPARPARLLWPVRRTRRG